MHNILLPWTESQLETLGCCGDNNIVVISVTIYGSTTACARLGLPLCYQANKLGICYCDNMVALVHHLLGKTARD